MGKFTQDSIRLAMLGSLEGYVFSVVDSIEFDIGRKLTSDEQKLVYRFVEDKINRATKEVAE
ncbi:hypothetical protein OGY18_19355 [Citrobacter sp. Cpo142]|uniref:hypothetical protein n=1 Tax=Citrobacter sp. Cpo142 TaxID=2985151 RepID=UPI0025784033|nr:hypothetical protein [Citrobacter sp. Cpo142]MDM2779264.1 hypothetical protein [Citrobacter sp. Cpo142]